MSNIDPTKPSEGQATTASVRANFQAAADEIDALVVVDGDLANDITAQGILIQNNADAITALDGRVTALENAPPAGGSSWLEVGEQFADGVKEVFDFVIPAGAKGVLVVYQALGNLGGAIPMRINFGSGGVPQVTGYEAIQTEITDGNSPNTNPSTTHFNGPYFISGDAYGYNSYIKFGSGDNRWMQGGTALMKSGQAGFFSGQVLLNGELDIIRVQNAPGQAAWLAPGSINVGYQL